MNSKNRREFLSQVANATMGMGAGLFCGKFLSAQNTPSTADAVARIYVDSRRTISPLDRNLFGSFLEHLGRAIYEGIYDPGSSFPTKTAIEKM